MTDAISEGYAMSSSLRCWASTTRAQGMRTPEELIAEGWFKVAESPWYPGCFLMGKREMQNG
jgi:hypothetical protein